MTAQRAQFAMIGLDIPVEFASIIRDLDVNWWQAVVVVCRFTALVHRPLRKSLTCT
jgi:hypothetical protein